MCFMYFAFLRYGIESSSMKADVSDLKDFLMALERRDLKFCKQFLYGVARCHQ